MRRYQECQDCQAQLQMLCHYAQEFDHFRHLSKDHPEFHPHQIVQDLLIVLGLVFRRAQGCQETNANAHFGWCWGAQRSPPLQFWGEICEMSPRSRKEPQQKWTARDFRGSLQWGLLAALACVKTSWDMPLQLLVWGLSIFIVQLHLPNFSDLIAICEGFLLACACSFQYCVVVWICSYSSVLCQV